MTETARQGMAEWAERLTTAVMAEVRRLRDEQGLRAVDVAQRVSQLGGHLPRTVLAKLESGDRRQLSVAELLVLAAALDVSPSALIAPFWRGEDVEILPGRKVDAERAFEWLEGRTSAPGLGVEISGDPKRVDAKYRWHGLMDQRDRHQRALAAVQGTDAEIVNRRIQRTTAAKAGDDDRVADLSRDIEGLSRRAQRQWEELLNIRALIRAEGNVPPPLPRYFALREQSPDDAPEWGPVVADGPRRDY